jgi:hypothetical protein
MSIDDLGFNRDLTGLIKKFTKPFDEFEDALFECEKGNSVYFFIQDSADRLVTPTRTNQAHDHNQANLTYSIYGILCQVVVYNYRPHPILVTISSYTCDDQRHLVAAGASFTFPIQYKLERWLNCKMIFLGDGGSFDAHDCNYNLHLSKRLTEEEKKAERKEEVETGIEYHEKMIKQHQVKLAALRAELNQLQGSTPSGSGDDRVSPSSSSHTPAVGAPL